MDFTLPKSPFEGPPPRTRTAPRTAPRIANVKTANSSIGEERERWSDEEPSDENEGDDGMFTFLRPTTAGDTSAAAHRDLLPIDSATSSEPSSFIQTRLSSAAAYALSSQHPSLPLLNADSASDQGVRQRGSWQQGNGRQGDGSDIGHVSMAASEGTRQWDVKSGASPEYGLYQDQGIQMKEMGKGGGLSPSEDEKNASDTEDYREGLGFEDYLDDEEDSPYPEVRASVSNIDDPDMPCLTFRSWFLGLFFTFLASAVNVFFFFRYPAPIVTPIIGQVISYPAGKLLAWLLPTTTFRVPKRLRWLFGDEASLNPGPFNIKEHTIIIIMANAATAPAFGLNFSVVSEKFYNLRQGVGFDILLLLTTQMLGFGIAGLCRRFLVWPASLIWPQNLVFCTLLNTLHAEDDDGEEGGITRYRFFIYIFTGAFFWYFLPNFLFQALSVFSFACWAAPDNVIVNQVFGVASGLGLSFITFDWAQIAFLGSPLVTPWWAEVNIFIGFVVAFCIFSPAMYYTNTWYSAYMPLVSSRVVDRFGNKYNTSRVIDITTSSLNVTAYEEYSPVYLPVALSTVYGLGLALCTSCLVHTFIYYGPDIWKQMRKVKTEEEDVHYKLMKEYPEVPDWWYFVHLIIFIGLSLVSITVWNTQLPVWAFFIALVFAAIFVLPGGFIFAMTSQQISINVVIELVAGYIMPGLPIANMLFKVYVSQIIGLALSFVQDLKLGHYMKIPPRATFMVQAVALALSCVLQVGVKEWLLYNVPDLCDRHQPALLTCPQTTVFYSASIIWGLIGPARQFSIGKLYNPVLYWLLVGAVLPIPFWFLSRRYPNSWLKYVNIPVLLTGAEFLPPATGINFTSWIAFAAVFQYWMRRNRFRWWSKFSFVLSAGLDSGTVLSGLVMFFALQLPKDGTLAIDWWGNNVFTNTADWNGAILLPVPEGGFGLETW